MSFTKVAPAGIGTEPGSTIRLGDSLLHSTGLDVGTGTGVGVTIRQHGDATFSGIVTASAFFGDGSGLEGVSSSGIGTALNDDDTNILNKIYYVNQELSIGSTVTVNHPDTGTASYTHYQDLVVKDDADFIVADGDTFIPDILGITTSTLAASAATGGRIRAGTITNAGANGAVNFPNGLVGTSATFTGVLTYEDVTNVDAVGIVTARSGINVSDGNVHIDDNGEFAIFEQDTSTAFTNSSKISMDFSSNIARIRSSWNGSGGNAVGRPLAFYIGSSEKLRIDSNGKLLAGTTSARNVAGGSAKLQIEATSSEGISLIRTSADNGGVYLSLGKTRNGSACQAGDKLGIISWNADDGTDLNHPSAEIYTEVVSGIGGNDVPGNLVFKTNGGSTTTTERLRITSAGKILGGNHINDRGAVLQIESSDHAMIGIHRNTNDHGAPAMNFSASRGTSAGSNTIVQSGDYLGLIRFSGTDGSDLASGAQITGIVDGTPGSNDMPTRLGFWTSADGSQSPVERMRISKEGYVTKPAHPSFHARLINHTNAASNPLVYDDVHVNVGSHYKSSGSDAGKFVVPVAGTYFFFWEAIKNGASGVTRLYLMKNGSRVYNSMHLRLQEEGNYANGCMNVIMTLAVNDKIYIDLSVGGVHASEYTHFGGYLIG